MKHPREQRRLSKEEGPGGSAVALCQRRAAKALTSASVLAFAATFGFSAVAQPAGIAKMAQVSTGVTDVAKEGFKTAEKESEDAKDISVLKLLAGGLYTTGNTRSLFLTGSFDYRLRRSRNQLSVQASANYAQAAPVVEDDAADPNPDLEETVNNYQGRVRYDRFFGGKMAAYFSVSGRHDPFQDLVLRLNMDPGLAYYFIDDKELQLWGELGYDLQYDVREEEAVADDVAKTEARHGARVFAGYVHSFSEDVSFDTSLEYIQALEDTKNLRINWGAALTSRIADSLSVATSMNVRYDNNPLEGVEETDIVTAFNIVYSF